MVTSSPGAPKIFDDHNGPRLKKSRHGDAVASVERNTARLDAAAEYCRGLAAANAKLADRLAAAEAELLRITGSLQEHHQKCFNMLLEAQKIRRTAAEHGQPF